MRLAGSGFLYETVEKDLATIFLLDSELRIEYCNAAWDKFALENGGDTWVRRKILGTLVLDVIPEPLRTFYAEAFRTVLESESPWEHDYECSSATTYRLMHMRIFRLPSLFLLVENSLRVEKPHDSEGLVSEPLEAMYRNQSGFIAACAHCRRVRRATSKVVQWDWVPDYVENPPERVTHGLCKSCRSYYFGY